eukprot:m.202188 g.202188  ORF g.202188 m.202188 type:complete len:69 (+) comp17061_c0_seq7:3425-3631(+)
MIVCARHSTTRHLHLEQAHVLLAVTEQQLEDIYADGQASLPSLSNNQSAAYKSYALNLDVVAMRQYHL